MHRRGARDPKGSTGSGIRAWFTPRRRFGLVVAAPIAVSIFSQFEFVQQSTCELSLLPAGLGRCEVLADLIAPAWALAIIPVARRLATAASRYGTPASDADSWLATRFATRRWAEGSARAAQWGAALVIVLAYTREWERFGEQPDAVWFVLAIVATLILLVVPVWWIRDELHARGVRYLSTARLPIAVERFLFDDSNGRPSRWPHVLAFSLVTFIVALTVLGQLDALLRGMHLPGDPSVGIGGLPSIDEFDLSKKPAVVIDRVGSWRAYTEAVGGRFGSAYDVVTAHALVDTIATIPAYVAGGVTLAFCAWRRRLGFGEASGVRRAFELVTLAGLFVLVATAVLDVAKNFLTWYVMDRAWTDPASLTNANVRLLFFSSLGRTIGLVILAAAVVLLLALSDTSTRKLRRALVAVRSEILLLIVFGVVVLMLPQTADVIRGWRVSHTMITVGLSVVLSMLVRWTAATNLRLQHRHWQEVQRGSDPVPPRIRMPLGETGPTLGRFAGAAIVAVALVQLALFGVGLRVGRGLLVPAVIVLVLWLFGLALPPAPYVRGDRPGSVQLRRRIPRMLGAGVYLIIGIAVVKAAAASVAYARHEDWWLFFALVPPAIGLWRIATRTTNTMGSAEAAFTAVVIVLAAVLYGAADPELSPTALSFAGLTFAYGSLPYFNSYERTSLVNRISERFLSPAWARPFVIGAGTAMTVVIVWFYLAPISLAPRIGTIGMVTMAMMVLTLIGAGAVRFAELTRPPRILAAFGIRRTPVVVLLGIWLLLAPAVVDQRVNDIRVVSGGAGTGIDGDAPAFDDVWQRWAAANLPAAPADATRGDGEQTVVPLLLVSSSGGGLRAAAWTSFVLDCVFEGAPGAEGPCSGERETDPALHRVAVVSGVSGGALGIAEYASHVLDGVDGPSGSNAWVDEVLGDDYLAASVGWLFFVDLPRSLIGFGTGIGNRAEIMERAWEESWPDEARGLQRGLGELWGTGFPPVVFNGTSVNDGCRVNVSALDVNGGSPEVPSCSGLEPDGRAAAGELGATHDLVDFLCAGDDVALSTAAGMSARFPVVSVAARVAAETERLCAGTNGGAVFVVDGGYLEGSGAGTLLDSWEALSGWVEQHNTSVSGVCVVPFMLHIDNGYESPSVSGNEAVPREFAVPLLTVFNASSGITAARAEAALSFEHPFTIAGSDVEIVLRSDAGEVPVTSRYARLVTRAHPGVQAPLGWTLSQASIDDLRDQLGIAENAAALAEIRSWLDGEMVCLGS